LSSKQSSIAVDLYLSSFMVKPYTLVSKKRECSSGLSIVLWVKRYGKSRKVKQC